MTHDIEKHKNDRQCVLQVNNYGYLIKHNTYKVEYKDYRPPLNRRPSKEKAHI